MKKRIFSIILIVMLIALCGCAKQEEVQTEPSVQPIAEEQTLSLHMQLWNEEDAPVAADKIVINTKTGNKLTATVENGIFHVEGVPYEPQLKCVLNDGSSIVAEFTLSFWTGYTLAYHNNLNTLSIDLPGNTSEVYLKALVRKDNAKVTCTFASPYSFDSEADAEDVAGNLTEQEAASAGLYGTKYASTTGLNLRAQPTTESESIAKLNFGDALSLMNAGEEIDGVMWYKVQLDAQTEGYVSGEFLGKKFIVNKNGVNIRKEATADSEAVHMVGDGTVVIAMDDGTEDGDYKWYHIYTRDGLNGYIRNDFLTMA